MCKPSLSLRLPVSRWLRLSFYSNALSDLLARVEELLIPQDDHSAIAAILLSYTFLPLESLVLTENKSLVVVFIPEWWLLPTTTDQCSYNTDLYSIACKFKVYLSPKNIFLYVKGTQFRSPLHQHSVKNINQVMVKCIQSLGSERETINLVPK